MTLKGMDDNDAYEQMQFNFISIEPSHYLGQETKKILPFFIFLTKKLAYLINLWAQ